jgi:hypothetical protein
VAGDGRHQKCTPTVNCGSAALELAAHQQLTLRSTHPDCTMLHAFHRCAYIANTLLDAWHPHPVCQAPAPAASSRCAAGSSNIPRTKPIGCEPQVNTNMPSYPKTPQTYPCTSSPVLRQALAPPSSPGCVTSTSSHPTHNPENVDLNAHSN